MKIKFIPSFDYYFTKLINYIIINFKNIKYLKLKNIIIVTGGAGFVGSNLIEFLLKKLNLKL